MEDMTVVFFYAEKQCGVEEKGLEKEKPGNKRRKRLRRAEQKEKSKKEKSKKDKSKEIKRWNYNVKVQRLSLPENIPAETHLYVWWVGLPFARNTSGTRVDGDCVRAFTSDYFRNLPIPPEGRYVYYAMDKPAEKLLGRGREPIGMEWILFLLTYYDVRFDSLVLIQDREMEAEELIRHFATRVAYLGIVADSYFDWEEVEESLSEEYGLVLDIGTDFEDLHIKGEKVLVIGTGNVEYAGMEWIWLDTAGRSRAGEELPGGTQNVTYVNMEHFLRDTVLDTAHKIKYNSTR